MNQVLGTHIGDLALIQGHRHSCRVPGIHIGALALMKEAYMQFLAVGSDLSQTWLLQLFDE